VTAIEKISVILTALSFRFTNLVLQTDLKKRHPLEAQCTSAEFIPRVGGNDE
jgi:hypothetical protein